MRGTKASLLSDVALAIFVARELLAEGRVEQASRTLDLAICWADVPAEELEERLKRLSAAAGDLPVLRKFLGSQSLDVEEKIQ